MSDLIVTIGEKTFEIEIETLSHVDREFQVLIDGQPVNVSLASGSFNHNNDEIDWLLISGRPYEFVLDHDFRWIKTNTGYYPLDVRERGSTIGSASPRPHNGDGRILAPIPGLITQVMVSEGDAVEAGQPLLILEAMKMENEIRSAQAGIVKVLNVSPGKGVKLHEVLAEIA